MSDPFCIGGKLKIQTPYLQGCLDFLKGLSIIYANM